MSNHLTIEDCNTVALKYLETDNVKIVDFSVVPLQNRNFLVEITVNHDAKEETLNFFAKSSFTTSKIDEILCQFKNTIPKFNHITPKLCYNKSDLSLFENLSRQGFKNYKSKGLLDLEHITVVLRILAKLHAGSFAYEEVKSKQGQKVYRLDNEYELSRCVIDLKKTAVTELISSHLEGDNLSEVVKNLEDRQSSSTTFRRTLCHGNLTFDNIMFKYKDGALLDCKLINFKSDLYSYPIIDVLQAIFFNSSENMRQRHYHSLLAYYYDCLNNELGKYQLKIGNIVPTEHWQQQSHHLLPLIKIQCLLCNKNVSPDELKEDLQCSLLSRQDCYAVVANKLKTTNYDFLSFEVTSLDAISGFLGDYHRLRIKVRHQSEPTTINCFVKCMPTSQASKDVLNDSSGFFKEAFVYDTIVPKFEELGVNMISDCLPACYFQRANHLLVFEDMSALDYQATSARVPYDCDTLGLVLKKVAKFHASCFVFEEKMSERLGRKYRLNDEYGEYFKEALMVVDQDHAGGRLMDTGVRAIMHAAGLFPELQTDENRENWSKFFPTLRRLFYDTMTASELFRNVLSHGDLWTCNILLKFADGRAVDCSFVDYQLVRYCPPGHDLLSVLHLTTLRETRLEHEDALLRIYYGELTRLLHSFGYDVDTILPYEDLQGGIERMRPQMVLQAAIYSLFSMCTGEEISSMLRDEEESNRAFFEDRSEFLERMYEASPIYKSRLRDRIRDVYDYCRSMSK